MWAVHCTFYVYTKSQQFKGRKNTALKNKTMKSTSNFERGRFISVMSVMPSFNHARAWPQSRMLSLLLGGMIVHCRSPKKLIPTRPESNVKIVNIKKEFHMHHAVSGRCYAWSAKTVFKCQTILEF